MTYILAYSDQPVPAIPSMPPLEDQAGQAPAPPHNGRPPGRREHFGTEEAALRRVVELLPAPPWRQMRLYGPDGVQIADQAALEMRFGKP